MTNKQAKKRWPPGKSVPKFATAVQEERFWLSHDFDDAMDTAGEEVVYEPQATRRPRKHVYRVRLDDHEMSKLQTLAKRRGPPDVPAIEPGGRTRAPYVYKVELSRDRPARCQPRASIPPRLWTVLPRRPVGGET